MPFNITSVLNYKKIGNETAFPVVFFPILSKVRVQQTFYTDAYIYIHIYI